MRLLYSRGLLGIVFIHLLFIPCIPIKGEILFPQSTGVPIVSSRSIQPYNLLLQNLFVSHGILEPEFQPDVFHYTVTLRHAHDQIAVTPEIDQNRPEYQGGEKNLPIITLVWPNSMSNKPESTSVAVRRQVDLPDHGESFQIYVNIMNPHDRSETQQYSITIKQSQESIVLLKSFEAVDDFGAPVKVDPVANQDDVVYNLYVNPDTEAGKPVLGCSGFKTGLCGGGGGGRACGNSLDHTCRLSVFFLV